MSFQQTRNLICGQHDRSVVRRKPNVKENVEKNHERADLESETIVPVCFYFSPNWKIRSNVRLMTALHGSIVSFSAMLSCFHRVHFIHRKEIRRGTFARISSDDVLDVIS